MARTKESYLDDVTWLCCRIEPGRDPDLHAVFKSALDHGENMLEISNRLLDASGDEKEIRRRGAAFEANPKEAE